MIEVVAGPRVKACVECRGTCLQTLQYVSPDTSIQGRTSSREKTHDNIIPIIEV